MNLNGTGSPQPLEGELVNWLLQLQGDWACPSSSPRAKGEHKTTETQMQKAATPACLPASSLVPSCPSSMVGLSKPKMIFPKPKPDGHSPASHCLKRPIHLDSVNFISAQPPRQPLHAGLYSPNSTPPTTLPLPSGLSAQSTLLPVSPR